MSCISDQIPRKLLRTCDFKGGPFQSENKPDRSIFICFGQVRRERNSNVVSPPKIQSKWPTKKPTQSPSKNSFLKPSPASKVQEDRKRIKKTMEKSKNRSSQKSPSLKLETLGSSEISFIQKKQLSSSFASTETQNISNARAQISTRSRFSVSFIQGRNFGKKIGQEEEAMSFEMGINGQKKTREKCGGLSLNSNMTRAASEEELNRIVRRNAIMAEQRQKKRSRSKKSEEAIRLRSQAKSREGIFKSRSKAAGVLQKYWRAKKQRKKLKEKLQEIQLSKNLLEIEEKRKEAIKCNAESLIALAIYKYLLKNKEKSKEMSKNAILECIIMIQRFYKKRLEKKNKNASKIQKAYRQIRERREKRKRLRNIRSLQKLLKPFVCGYRIRRVMKLLKIVSLQTQISECQEYLENSSKDPELFTIIKKQLFFSKAQLIAFVEFFSTEGKWVKMSKEERIRRVKKREGSRRIVSSSFISTLASPRSSMINKHRQSGNTMSTMQATLNTVPEKDNAKKGKFHILEGPPSISIFEDLERSGKSSADLKCSLENLNALQSGKSEIKISNKVDGSKFVSVKNHESFFYLPPSTGNHINSIKKIDSIKSGKKSPKRQPANTSFYREKSCSNKSHLDISITSKNSSTLLNESSLILTKTQARYPKPASGQPINRKQSLSLQVDAKPVPSNQYTSARFSNQNLQNLRHVNSTTHRRSSGKEGKQSPLNKREEEREGERPKFSKSILERLSHSRERSESRGKEKGITAAKSRFLDFLKSNNSPKNPKKVVKNVSLNFTKQIKKNVEDQGKGLKSKKESQKIKENAKNLSISICNPESILESYARKMETSSKKYETKTRRSIGLGQTPNRLSNYKPVRTALNSRKSSTNIEIDKNSKELLKKPKKSQVDENKKVEMKNSRSSSLQKTTLNKEQGSQNNRYFSFTEICKHLDEGKSKSHSPMSKRRLLKKAAINSPLKEETKRLEALFVEYATSFLWGVAHKCKSDPLEGQSDLAVLESNSIFMRQLPGANKNKVEIELKRDSKGFE